MNHGSLYTGIGGWLLSARWAGIDNIFTCEIDKFCNKVIDKQFSEIPKENRHHDIKETDFTKYKGTIDILSTSDPCQPFSFAGKRGGKEDDRFLWPFTIKAIRAIKPKFVVFENVPGLINMAHEYKRVKVGMEDKATYGGIYKKHFYNTWEAYIFEQILTDLEKEGYQVESFIIPACAVGAWHRRDRLWIIAYNEKFIRSSRKIKKQKECQRTQFENRGLCSNVSNTECEGLQRESIGQMGESSKFTEDSKDVPNSNSQRGCSRDSGRENAEDVGQFIRSSEFGPWDIEPNVGRVAHGIPNRVDRLKSLGNSIVPQIALILFEAIKNIENGKM